MCETALSGPGYPGFPEIAVVMSSSRSLSCSSSNIFTFICSPCSLCHRWARGCCRSARTALPARRRLSLSAEDIQRQTQDVLDALSGHEIFERRRRGFDEAEGRQLARAKMGYSSSGRFCRLLHGAGDKVGNDGDHPVHPLLHRVKAAVVIAAEQLKARGGAA